MASSSSLYNNFTKDGTLEQRWANYGMSSSYDPESETLSVTVPEGWTNTLSEEEKAARKDDWCIDDASCAVDYSLVITSPQKERRVEKMQICERNNERYEFQTSVFFEPLVGVKPGARVGLELIATAKMAKGPPKIVTLVKGEFESKERIDVIGTSSPGYFFLAEGGFAVFIHFGAKSCVTNITFVGRLDDIIDV
jgi:hypothetical protein